MVPYSGEDNSFESQVEDGWLFHSESLLPSDEIQESEAARRHLPGEEGHHLQLVSLELRPQFPPGGPAGLQTGGIWRVEIPFRSLPK